MRIYNNELQKEIENYLNIDFNSLNIIKIRKSQKTLLDQSEKIKILCRSNNDFVDIMIVDNKLKVITLLQKNGEDHQYILLESDFGKLYCIKKILFKFEKNHISVLNANYSKHTFMKKRVIITMVLAGILGLAQAQNNSTSDQHVQSATAISRVVGDGRKVETVILQYDTPIRNKSLSTESFRVEGKEVTRIYANSAPERAEKGKDGQYVIIEVKAEVDLNAKPQMPTEEDKKKGFEKTVLENYKTVSDYETQAEKLKTAEGKVETLTESLEKFKDVNVDELNSTINTLKTDLANKDQELKDKLADRDFNDLLKDSISAAKGRNATAITACLDVDTLKASKNQKEDIAAALKALSEREDCKMLFGEPEPDVIGGGNPIGTVTKSGSQTGATDVMRSIMGLPPVNTK